MAQAKITINDTQEKALGLLVYHTKGKYPILYDPKSGVNLRKTKAGESITVKTGVKLDNLKKFQTAGYFDVIEGTILDHVSAFNSIEYEDGTLTINFTENVTSSALICGTDIVIKIDGTEVVDYTVEEIDSITNAKVMTIELTEALIDEDVISVEIKQSGASKIFDSNRSAILPATKTYTIPVSEPENP